MSLSSFSCRVVETRCTLHPRPKPARYGAGQRSSSSPHRPHSRTNLAVALAAQPRKAADGLFIIQFLRIPIRSFP